MTTMTPKQFWETAASWGSAMTSGDPGACMYGFDEKGLVQSEQHRADCINWIEKECRKAAIANVSPEQSLDELNAELDALVAYLRTAPIAGALPNLDEFTKAYIEAALWSSSDPDSDSDQSLSATYSAEHVSRRSLDQIISDCAHFQELYGHLFEGSESDAGHDFWLTRCGHGAGFWDGDWEDKTGSILTAASESFGNFDLLVGDDGFIHGCGGNSNPEPVEGARTASTIKPG